MRLKIFLASIILTLSTSAICVAQNTKTSNDYARFVDPFIGTGGHGHTFPGATLPFGMVQLSPDTREDNWDGSSGYHYSDDIIYGFSHTHLSGTGIPDGCDILLMPVVGDPTYRSGPGDKNVNGDASKFSHSTEKAEPGYYSVRLEDDSIFAEMTAAPRVGLHRYTFSAAGRINFLLDLKWRDAVLDSDIDVVGNRIEGFRRSNSWAKNQAVYFVIEFSKPLKYKLPIHDETAAKDQPGTRPNGSREVRNLKTAIQFDVEANEKIMIKVALSPVSIEGARKNLKAELPHWNFEKVKTEARAAWNKELSKIEVSGGAEAQMKTFYTALYHTMIHPNIFNDVDGRYKGLDGKIYQLPGHEDRGKEKSKTKSQKQKAEHFTVFSLWDTFRAAHPLYTIVDQKRTANFINTFIRHFEEGGRLPVWELWSNETDTMIGYHAVSVIADAMAKGVKGFDYEKAYKAARASAALDHFGLGAYKRRGYISMEDEQESVSKTLEYAYNDWCLAIISREMALIDFKRYEKKSISVPNTYLADHEEHITRSGYYRNLFDPQTGFMRPRQNGGFVRPFAPNEVTFHFTEGNSWQYSFFVPHDVNGLINLYGGSEKFARKLDELFTTESKLAGREQPDITGLIGQYAHGNEPSHHIAYLYNYAGQPWKTQRRVRQIMDEFYQPTPDGLIGNEDCGQMSAWYVLSASGFYPVAPGDARYDIGTPLFPEMTYRLENGKKFTIRAKNISDKNIYILNAKLNGKALKRSFIEHGELMKDGALEFAMIDTPVTTAFDEFIVREIRAPAPAVPRIEAVRMFAEKTTVFMRTITPGAAIYYTLDGSTPTERSEQYQAPVTITDSAAIKAIAVNAKGEKSLVAEAVSARIPNNWTVQIFSKYNRQYTGGGDYGLIDGIRGTENFASGEWQGYQGQDFTAVIDLQKETEIKRLGGGFLQVARSWIWMPTKVEFELSTDGENFTKAAEIKTDVAPENMEHIIRDYKTSITPTKARYVRVKAANLGKIPAWHPGAGFEAFIFVDEIFVE
jgi:predicted alpha-1,2-mannosidase